MSKKLTVLLLVLVLILSFAVPVWANNKSNGEDNRAKLIDNQLYVPVAKEKAAEGTPPSENPIDVAGA